MLKKAKCQMTRTSTAQHLLRLRLLLLLHLHTRIQIIRQDLTPNQKPRQKKGAMMKAAEAKKARSKNHVCGRGLDGVGVFRLHFTLSLPDLFFAVGSLIVGCTS